MSQFCRVFVKTPKHFPRRDLVLKALIWFALAIMVFQPGLAYYPPELRFLLHIATWLVAVAVALFLPFVGYAAMKQLGFQSSEEHTSELQSLMRNPSAVFSLKK